MKGNGKGFAAKSQGPGSSSTGIYAARDHGFLINRGRLKNRSISYFSFVSENPLKSVTIAHRKKH